VIAAQGTARNVIVVSAASFLQIIVQFLFQRVMAGWYGAGAETDALAAAIALPTLFAAIVTGSLSYVLVPELVSKFTRLDQPQNDNAAAVADNNTAWQLASFIGLLTFALSFLCSLILYGLAEPLCYWLYGDLKPSTLQLTSQLLRILSIQVALNGLISWAQAVHHSRHHFLMPALGGVIGTAISLAVAYQFGDASIKTLAWAINLGSLLSALIHFAPLIMQLRVPHADYAAMLRLSQLFWPLLLGAALLRVDPLVDRVLASKISVDGPGAVASINYAHRMLAALLAIGTSGLAIVAFPQLAQRLEGTGTDSFARHFALAFRRLILVVVPITLGFSFFSVWIIRDLLEHKAFTHQDSIVVGWLIVALMGMFAGASCAELLARAFYAVGDTKSPTLIGVVALLISWVIKVWLYLQIGLWGIALGVSVYCVLSAAGMAWWLSRRFGSNLWNDCSKWFLQALLSTLIACCGCYIVYQLISQGTWVAAPTGAVIYFTVLLGLKNADAQQLWETVRWRMAR